MQKEFLEIPLNHIESGLVLTIYPEGNSEIREIDDLVAKEFSESKYQILEGKLMNDNEIKLEYADILSQAEQLVKNQLAIYGIHHLSDEEIQKYAVEMLKDQEQVR